MQLPNIERDLKCGESAQQHRWRQLGPPSAPAGELRPHQHMTRTIPSAFIPCHFIHGHTWRVVLRHSGHMMLLSAGDRGTTGGGAALVRLSPQVQVQDEENLVPFQIHSPGGVDVHDPPSWRLRLWGSSGHGSKGGEKPAASTCQKCSRTPAVWAPQSGSGTPCGPPCFPSRSRAAAAWVRRRWPRSEWSFGCFRHVRSPCRGGERWRNTHRTSKCTLTGPSNAIGGTNMLMRTITIITGLLLLCLSLIRHFPNWSRSAGNNNKHYKNKQSSSVNRCKVSVKGSKHERRWSRWGY